MGGHALVEGSTERKSREEYFAIKSAVLHLLESQGENVMQVLELKEMPGKTSFGDLDLLYVLRDGKEAKDVDTLLRELVPSTQIVRSGHITSFAYQRCQVDLIQCTPQNLAMTQFCLSYGDRGMILGHIARYFGFSLGSQGLAIAACHVPTLIGENTSIKYILTTDPDAVRQFMGLPEEDVIETPDDVIDLCTSSPWFRPEIFTRQVNNCVERKKFSHRSFYKAFVDSLVSKYGYCDERDEVALAAMRKAKHEEALTYFNRWDGLYALRDEAMRRKTLQGKLNGKHFLSLGVAPSEINRRKEQFQEWLLQQHGQQDSSVDDTIMRLPGDELHEILRQWCVRHAK